MKFTAELKKALARGKSALEYREKLTAALAAAVALQPGAEARLQSSMEQLGAVEADAAIEGRPAPAGDAHAAVTDARAVCDALQARIGGLNRRLTLESAEEIAAASEELERARIAFHDESLAEYRTQIRKAAAEFVAILRQGAALADALRFDPMETEIRNIKILDPTALDSNAPLIDMDTTEFRHRSTVRVPSWKGDSAAEKLFAEVSGPAVIASALKAVIPRPAAQQVHPTETLSVSF